MFIIQSDHCTLKWLDHLKNTNARLTRWSLTLQQYRYKVVCHPGLKNGNAGGLSKYLDQETPIEDGILRRKECKGPCYFIICL